MYICKVIYFISDILSRGFSFHLHYLDFTYWGRRSNAHIKFAICHFRKLLFCTYLPSPVLPLFGNSNKVDVCFILAKAKHSSLHNHPACICMFMSSRKDETTIHILEIVNIVVSTAPAAFLGILPPASNVFPNYFRSDWPVLQLYSGILFIYVQWHFFFLYFMFLPFLARAAVSERIPRNILFYNSLIIC